MAPKMMCVFTQKGGVGKTTGTYNLATTLALGGARVLMIDADPQANLTRNAIRFVFSNVIKRENIKINDDVKQILIGFIEGNLILDVAADDNAQRSNDTRFREIIRKTNGTEMLLSAFAAVMKSGSKDEKNPITFYLNEGKLDREKVILDFQPIITLIDWFVQSENMLTGLEWINRDVGTQYIDKHAEKIAGNLFPIFLNDEKEKVNDNLLLLPGHQLLYLHHSRPIALAIEGLKSGTDSALASFAGRLHRINQFLRKLGEIKDIDIIIIDLSPTAIEFNQAMVMMSDYLTMTLSPEPNSDHAMFSMLPILRHWKTEFDKIYGIPSDAGFMPIVAPPKVLGVFFQKATTHLDRIKSPVSTFIVDRILDFYTKDLTPYLRDHAMDGGVDVDKLPKISNFTSEAKSAQYHGEPIVLNPDLPYHDSFKKIISLIFQKEKSNLPARLLADVNNFTKHKETSFDNLSKNWTNKYTEYLSKIDNATRYKKLTQFKHHMDYYDFRFLLLNLILKKYKSMDNYNNNPQRVHVTEPLVIDDSQKSENYFLKPLLEAFKNFPKRQDGLKPKILIIPFLMQNRWRCLRVEINESRTVDVLFDDPFGGKLVKNNRNRKSTEHIWDSTLREYIMSSLSDAILKHYQFTASGWYPRCKNHNQQNNNRNYEGYSAIIILNNIVQYMEPTKNQDFKKICSYKILQGVVTRLRLEEVTVSVDVPKSDVSAAYPVDISSIKSKEIKSKYIADLKRILDVNGTVEANYFSYLEKVETLSYAVEKQRLSLSQLSTFILQSLELILDELRGLVDKKFYEAFRSNPDAILDFIAAAQLFYDHHKDPALYFTRHAIEAGEAAITPRQKPTKKTYDKKDIDRLLKAWQPEAIRIASYDFTANPRTNYFGLIHPPFDYVEGNCLFDAVAVQTPTYDAIELRALAVSHISQHDALRAFLLSMADHTSNLIRTVNGDRNYTTVEQYLEYMAEDRTWATTIEVRALADALQRPIVLLGPSFEQIFFEQDYQENEPIFLDYINNNHYEPRIPPHNRNGHEIFNQIRQTSGVNAAQPGQNTAHTSAQNPNKRVKMSTDAPTRSFVQSTRGGVPSLRPINPANRQGHSANLPQ